MPITVPCFSIGNIPLVFVRLVIALVPSGKQFHNLQAKQVSKGSQNIDRGAIAICIPSEGDIAL